MHDQNKMMIWQALKQSPMFIESRVDLSWFVGIMTTCNESFPTILDADRLMECNRRTLQCMIENMGKRVKQIRETETLEPLYSRFHQSPETSGGYSDIKPKPPPEIDFRIEMPSDEILPNIVELVEVQRREREAIYDNAFPASIAPRTDKQRLVIKEHSDTDIIEYHINDPPIVLAKRNIQESDTNSKRQTSRDDAELYRRIDKLECNMKDISDRFEELNELLERSYKQSTLAGDT